MCYLYASGASPRYRKSSHGYSRTGGLHRLGHRTSNSRSSGYSLILHSQKGLGLSGYYGSKSGPRSSFLCGACSSAGLRHHYHSKRCTWSE